MSSTENDLFLYGGEQGQGHSVDFLVNPEEEEKMHFRH